MKFTVAVLILLGIAVLAKTKQTKKYVPAFVKSLENLHRGPPEIPSTDIVTVHTKWIPQKLDHFDKQNNKTWNMRYLVNEHNFEDGGPMFIYLGGEWRISSGAIVEGIFPDLAEEHKGILFYTEHRYYGSSKPTSDLGVENLEYLHVKQALADVAHFIRTQRETDPRLANSKVIIAGGSYSATMVVWFSKLYPELVNGGWASSAPILAQVNFKEYHEVVGKALVELGSQQCYNRIENAIAELEDMLEGKRSAEAKAMFQLCDNFDHKNDLDLWSFFATISNIFAGIVQYQREGTIPFYCDYLMSFDDDLTALGTFFVNSVSGGEGCVDVTYASTLDFYRITSYDFGASRPWYYQTCNEYGWYQSSGSRNQPMGTKFPATLYTTLCYDIFGSLYTNEHIHKLVANTNKDFGGMKPNVTNVYMTHGALDPWSAMGHQEKHGASVIPRTSHCADFGSISTSDSKEMRASKLRLRELVSEWLA